MKDERHLDKFDQVFGHVFKGLELMSEAVEANIPEEWLRAVASLYLSDEEKAKIEALGGWEKIMEELKKRLAEQKGRHQGGNKWIGTGGTSPYRRRRLQSCRRAHRPEENPQQPRRQGLGQARVQGSRRQGRTRHPQHQGGAAPPAQVRARGRRR